MQSGLVPPVCVPCLRSYDPIHTVGSLLAAVLFVYMGLEVRYHSWSSVQVGISRKLLQWFEAISLGMHWTLA